MVGMPVELREKIVATLASGTQEDRYFREFRLKGWPKYHPRFWPKGACFPNPFNWLRARVLYALVPADASMWKVLRHPVGVIVFCCGMTSAYAISVWLFVLLFVLIDKRDEFQLVNFILKFKGFQAHSVHSRHTACTQ